MTPNGSLRNNNILRTLHYVKDTIFRERGFTWTKHGLFTLKNGEKQFKN